MVSLGVCSWYFCPQFDVFPFAHREQWKTPVEWFFLPYEVTEIQKERRKSLPSIMTLGVCNFPSERARRKRKALEGLKIGTGIEVITLPETNIAPKNDGFQ